METQKNVNNERLMQDLREILNAEDTMYSCCARIASLIKNGRARNTFNSLAESARTNKEFLKGCLYDLGEEFSAQEDGCKIYAQDAESFSLLGALNLGLEIASKGKGLYADLVKLSEDRKDRMVFRQSLLEKQKERASLQKEKNFLSRKEEILSPINSLSITGTISKLLR